MEFFEMRVFLENKINNFDKLIKNLIYKYSEIIGHTHLFPLHNEPSPKHVGLKLWEK